MNSQLVYYFCEIAFWQISCQPAKYIGYNIEENKLNKNIKTARYYTKPTKNALLAYNWRKTQPKVEFSSVGPGEGGAIWKKPFQKLVNQLLWWGCYGDLEHSITVLDQKPSITFLKKMLFFMTYIEQRECD